MATTTLLIRDAEASDAEGMARVEVETWQATYPGMLPAMHLAAMNVPRARARWLRTLGLDPRRFALVAELEGEIVAFASGSLAGGQPDRMARLDMLYVLPGFQRIGLGRALTHALATRISASRVRALWVDVLAKNQRARRFYRALGAIELQRTWSFVGTSPIVVVAYGWSLPDGLARMA